MTSTIEDKEVDNSQYTLSDKIDKQESFLKSLFFISTNFKDISNGRTNLVNRVVQAVILVYLMAEMIKVCFWIYLKEDHWFSLATGSYMFLLKTGGKLIYLAIVSLTLQAFIYRIGFFVAEGNKNGLDFVTEPMKYLQSQKDISKNALEVKFRSQFENQYKDCHIEWKSLALLTNLFVTVLCIRSVRETGMYGSFMFGWISHFFQSNFFNISNSISGFHWKISMNFVEMKMTMLNNKLDAVLSKDVKSNKNLEADIREIMDDSEKLEDTVSKFDQTLRILLFSAIAATTPLTTTMIHSLIFGENEKGWFLQLLQMIILPIFVFQGWSPCYVSTNIYSTSLKLYDKLNRVFVRFSNGLHLETKLELQDHIKRLGSNRKPLAIFSLEGSAYTPLKFFLYLMSCIQTLLMIIDDLRV